MLKYQTLQSGNAVKGIEALKPFKCVVLSSGNVPDGWKMEVARQLIHAGCLYVMTWGKECKLWHDIVDEVFIKDVYREDLPDDQFVMTTWHDGEALSDVMHFAKHSADNVAVELKNLLILDVGKPERQAELFGTYASV